MARRGMRWLSIGVATIAFGAALALLSRLEPAENITALLPDKDPVVSDYRMVGESFRALDALYIDIGPGSTKASSEDVIAVADALHERLAASDLFETVIYRFSSERWADFFDELSARSGRLLTAADLTEIEGRLTEEAIARRLAAARRELLQPTGVLAARNVRRDPLGFNELLMEKLGRLGRRNGGRLADGRIWSPDLEHLLMVAVSRSSAMDTVKGAEILSFLNDAVAASVKAAPGGAVRVSTIGGHRAALDNTATMKKDTSFTITAVSLAILALGLLFFRRRIFIVLTLLPALFGLTCASGLIALFAPRISGVVIGCGAVLVGIAVDYGIHLLFHLDASDDEHLTPAACVRRLRVPLAMGAVTTAGALLCLLFSSLPGQRKLGVFAALGVLGAVLFATLVLPHLVRMSRTRMREPVVPLRALCASLLGWIAAHRGLLALLWALALAASLVGWRRLRFEGDVNRLNHLRPAAAEDEKRVLAVWGSFSETSVIVRGKTLEQALQANDALLRTLRGLTDEGAVESVSSIAPLFPSAGIQEENLRRWRGFWSDERLSVTRRRFGRAAVELKFKPEAFAPFFDGLRQPAAALTLADFSGTGIEDILAAHVAQAEGGYLVRSGLVCDLDALDGVTSRLRSGLPDAIVWNGQRFVEHTTRLVQKELIRLTLAALVVMTVCLFLFVGRIELVVATLLPVCLGVVLTLGVLGLVGIPINLMNCLFIVFVFGVGVDFSIFLVNTSLAAYRGQGAYAPATCGSVVICALTTMSGFTALSFATHPALRSVGLTGLIGMAASLSAALTLVPLLMARLLPNEGRYGTPSLKTFGGAVWAFVYLVGSAVVYLFVLRPFVWLRFPRTPLARQRFMRKGNRLVAAGLLKFFPYLDSERIFIDADRSAFEKPGVIVSNHRSAFDIMVILALPVEMAMVVKGWVWKAPLIGTIAREAGFILVGDDEPEEVLARCRERLDEGVSVMFFPEGSRSPDGRMRRFHKGAFELAAMTGADVIPVHLSNTEACIPRKALWVGDHRSVIHVLPRVTRRTFDYTLAAKDFARHVKDQLLEFDHEDWRIAQDGKAFWHNIRTLYNYRGPYVEKYVAWKLRLDPIYHGIDALVPEEGSVLDLGCGYGLTSNILAQKSRSRQVLGVDLDERKIAVAQGAAIAVGNARFELHDALEWDYPESDVVLLIDVLHYWSEEKQQALIAKACACLRPGGTLLFREACKAPTWRHRVTAGSEVFSTGIGHNRRTEPLCFLDRNFYASAFESRGLVIRSEGTDLTRGSDVLFVMRKET